jgi:DNA repair exonuclease SbcCD ATPase subunit
MEKNYNIENKNMINKIKQLESQFEEFTQQVGSLQGEYKTLLNQQNDSNVKIEKYKKDEIIYTQAVELLSLVQKVTRDKIKNAFENIVTHALNYIFESDKYSFHLVFGRRGNLQELNFAVQTPDKTEPLNPMDTDAGGTLNVISLALRIVLMEVASPKINGFIISDESFANLSEEYVERASQFLKEINQKMNRQIIAISHQSKMLDSADKLIEVK